MKIVFLSAAASAAIFAVVACSGGSGSTSASPEDQCRDFLTLTQDCAAQGGKTLSTNSAACSDPNAITEQQRAQITCSLEHRDAYCKTIVASFSRDAGAIDPYDPEVVKLNACVSSATLESPCKDAVLAVAACGVPYYVGARCDAAGKALAQCVLNDTPSACSLLAPRRTNTTLTPAEQAFQKCQLDAQRVRLDAGG